jgi:TPR repeat protein
MATLRRRAAAGEVAAMTDLGLSLLEGVQDRDGRCLVRRHSPYAVRLLRSAADSGDSTAAFALAYAYDTGKGARRDTTQALRWYRRAARDGSDIAAANIATIYRNRGNLRLAHHWLLRAANRGDGDAALTAGYDYLYGIGVRRDRRSARRLLHRALRGNTTPCGREEALYHLAVADIDRGDLRGAIPFLEQASKDGDYPEAQSLLAQIRARTTLDPCRCRRHIWKDLPGHADCPVHRAWFMGASTPADRSFP